MVLPLAVSDSKIPTFFDSESFSQSAITGKSYASAAKKSNPHLYLTIEIKHDRTAYYSMVKVDMLYQIDQRLKEIMVSQEVFGGVAVILLGNDWMECIIDNYMDTQISITITRTKCILRFGKDNKQLGGIIIHYSCEGQLN